MKKILILGLLAIGLLGCAPSWDEQMVAVKRSQDECLRSYDRCVQSGSHICSNDCWGVSEATALRDRALIEGMSQSSSDKQSRDTQQQMDEARQRKQQQLQDDADSNRAMDLAIAHDARANGDYEQARQWEQKAQGE